MRLLDKDFGTPPVAHFDPNALVSLTIDGQTVRVPRGTSIMRAAASVDSQIPKLCATDSLDAFGSCRMCVVQIQGRNGYVAACTEPVADGIVVETQNDAIAKLRRGVMELYISDHPLDCLTCTANGDCELQDVAGQVGLREVRYEEGANHLSATKDESNPYFTFDPSKCIVCSRCVRACDEIQGTFALTIDDRGFASTVSTGLDSFFDSECVSCGACVQACPTATLMEKSVIEHGIPDRTVKTTCAYCGVGCSFKAEMKGDQVVRMVPDKHGKANHGASCVKGRFAWGYANHPDRITKPLIRSNIDEPWQEVPWDVAIEEVAKRLSSIQKVYGRKSIGAVSSSRTTIEEIYVVQKLVRTAFGNNNIDTCARVCHSPTGYGLNQTFGAAAGTQNFDSVDESDLILLIGANPTHGHPVFASRMKQRLREGASIIVADPREIDLVRSPHVEAAIHLPLKPGTNLPFINSLAHVVVTEDRCDLDFVRSRCEVDSFEDWYEFIRREENAPENVAKICGVSADDLRRTARLYAAVENASIYYGLGVTEHSQGSAMVMGMANLAMATGNIGRPGVGINPLRGQNNVQGSTDVGSFPHELPGHRHISSDSVRNEFSNLWGVTLDAEPGYRIPNMFDEAVAGTFKGMYIQGEDFAQSDPNTKHVEEALSSMDCVIVQDLFLTETAKFAHIFLPATSFLEKDGTFVNAERRFNRVRPAISSKTGKEEWQITCEIAQAMGYDMCYESAAEILDELALSTPDFEKLSFQHLDNIHSAQWPVTEQSPYGTPVMHAETFTRGKGLFKVTEYVPTEERTNRKFPLLLTTGRKLHQYNVGTQTRRTPNVAWLDEDVLEIHPSDAELRGIHENDWVSIRSRVGEITLRAEVTDKVVPGVVYTTFHYPGTGTNVITTNLSDEFTNCPEYKVTAVEVAPANHQAEWQLEFKQRRAQQVEHLPVGT